MKLNIKIVILLYIILILMSIHTYAYEININDAISRGYIEVIIRGTGEYHGDEVIYIYIENVYDNPLDIIVPQGLILEPNDPEYQDMIVALSYTINLEPYESKSLYIAAFCIEINDLVPDDYIEFMPSYVTTNNDLIKLLKYIDNNNLINSYYAQIAIWSISDGPYTVKDKLIEWLEEEGYTYDEIILILEPVIEETNDILEGANLNQYKIEPFSRSERIYSSIINDPSTIKLIIYIVIIIIFIISIAKKLNM